MKYRMYVVLVAHDHESTDVLGVFSSKDKAEYAMAYQMNEHQAYRNSESGHGVWIEEHVLDEFKTDKSYTLSNPKKTMTVYFI